MITEQAIVSATLITTHNNREPFHFMIPNVKPGEYLIPGIGQDPEWVERHCRITIIPQGGRPEQAKEFQYAHIVEKYGTKYVKLDIFNAVSFRYFAEIQEFDEYGAKMNPPVARVGLPIPCAQVANEIERGYGHMGLMAVPGVDPTEEELKEAVGRNLKYKRNVIKETNKLFRMVGESQVTEQAIITAAELHERGLLNPLPDWATLNPEALPGTTFNCLACGHTLRKNAVSCTECHAIYDWEKAVDLGIKSVDQVPPSRRAEAGLDKPKDAAKAAATVAGQAEKSVDEDGASSAEMYGTSGGDIAGEEEVAAGAGPGEKRFEPEPKTEPSEGASDESEPEAQSNDG